MGRAMGLSPEEGTIMLMRISPFGNYARHRLRGVIPGCVPAPHDKTLLETLGIPERTQEEAEAHIGRFCNAIRAHIRGEISAQELKYQMSIR